MPWVLGQVFPAGGGVESESVRVALVTGAAGGIGSALSRRLAAEGWRVALLGRNEQRLQTLSGELAGSRAFPVDVTDSAAVDSAWAAVEQEMGTPTAVAHCVGSIMLKSAHQLSDQDWLHTIALNLSSAFYLLRVATKSWSRQSVPGSLVFCSSAAARLGLANHEAIGAAKAGLEGLVRSAAATYAARGIRVNAVAPGLVRTDLAAKITGSEGALRASVAMHPLRRIGEPQEVASALAWFLQPEQSWVTGQILGVDGGLGSLKTLPPAGA